MIVVNFAGRIVCFYTHLLTTCEYANPHIGIPTETGHIAWYCKCGFDISFCVKQLIKPIQERHSIQLCTSNKINH